MTRDGCRATPPNESTLVCPEGKIRGTRTASDEKTEEERERFVLLSMCVCVINFIVFIFITIIFEC